MIEDKEQCKKCLHYQVCANVMKRQLFIREVIMGEEDPKCEYFLPTADVVPRSEVNQWYHEYHVIKDELKREKMYHKETEKLADKYCAELQTAKAEVAREILGEIEEIINRPHTVVFSLLAPLKQALAEYNAGVRKELLYYVAESKKKYVEGGDTD